MFYHIVNRICMKIPIILRYMIQIILGFFIGFMYYYGLVYLNDGILRMYFFIVIFLGFVVYQKYYAKYMLYYLEIILRFIRRILTPFFFFFHSINAIILRNKKKVENIWRKREKKHDTRKS
ncbi:MAG: hypothetical protein LUH02_08145 [Erysipelotrichaceae bacterium]|nr:hypothetical protein [Erysipelotrichaceae bacterium]